MRHISVGFAALIGFAGCHLATTPFEGEGEGNPQPFEIGNPLRSSCRCGDSTTIEVCTSADACTVAHSDECENACRSHGGNIGFDCPSFLDVGCLLADKNEGSSAVLCACNGGRDGGGCTSLDCDEDAAAIQEVCSAYCPTSTAEPVCVASDSCANDGAPPGRDRVDCSCNDGSKQSSCTVGECSDGDKLTSLCNDLCDAHGGVGDVSCTVTEIGCALDGGAGANAVSCNCLTGFNVGACTDLRCDDDEEAIQAACDDACAQLSNPPGGAAPTCTPDPSCAAGGPPNGPDLSFCRCTDGFFTSSCGVGCPTCDATCADHGGESSSGCSQSELRCVLGGGAAGGPNAVGCRCNGGDSVITRCGDVSCDDETALAAACADACFGADAEVTCEADNEGCVAGAPASGPIASVCGCGDGTSVSTCVADCDDLTLTLSCFSACTNHGNFTAYDCSSSPECGG